MSEIINDLRRRVLAGEEVPAEELRAAIGAHREERFKAMTATIEKKEKSNALAGRSLDDLFNPPKEEK